MIKRTIPAVSLVYTRANANFPDAHASLQDHGCIAGRHRLRGGPIQGMTMLSVFQERLWCSLHVCMCHVMMHFL